MHYTTGLLVLMGSVASAAPSIIPRTSGPIQQGTTFNLRYIANGAAPDAVAALRTGTWHVGVRDDRVALDSEASNGSLFYKYGSGPSIGTASTGITIFPGGTSTVPNGAPVEVVNNNSTTGTLIRLNDSGEPTLWNDGGRFQACAEKTGDGFYLSYVESGQRWLADCAPVELRADCSSVGQGSELVGQLGQPSTVPCWSV